MRYSLLCTPPAIHVNNNLATTTHKAQQEKKNIKKNTANLQSRGLGDNPYPPGKKPAFEKSYLGKKFAGKTREKGPALQVDTYAS